MVKEDTLAFVLFVVDEVDGVTFGVVGLEEVLHTFGGFLVSEVDEVGLPLWEDELAGWQVVKGVLA